MFPAGPRMAEEDGWERREERIRMWRERRGPTARWAPGDPRHWEAEHCAPAELTPLGRRLLGVDIVADAGSINDPAPGRFAPVVLRT